MNGFTEVSPGHATYTNPIRPTFATEELDPRQVLLDRVRAATEQMKIRTKAMEDEAWSQKRAREDAETARTVKGWEEADVRRLKAADETPTQKYTMPGPEGGKLSEVLKGTGIYKTPGGVGEADVYSNIGVTETIGPTLAEQRVLASESRKAAAAQEKERMDVAGKTIPELLKTPTKENLALANQLLGAIGLLKAGGGGSVGGGVKAKWDAFPKDQQVALWKAATPVEQAALVKDGVMPPSESLADKVTPAATPEAAPAPLRFPMPVRPPVASRVNQFGQRVPVGPSPLDALWKQLSTGGSVTYDGLPVR